MTCPLVHANSSLSRSLKMMTDMGLAVVVADGNFFVAAAVAAGPLERQRQKTTQVKNYEPREQSLVLLAFDDG